jgi:hypothetical protein
MNIIVIIAPMLEIIRSTITFRIGDDVIIGDEGANPAE